jgi:HlyD family secretion protein
MGSRRLVRRSTVLPAALVLLAGGGGLAWATAGAAAPGYRTAVVATGDVQQLLTLTGTVQNVDQTRVSFPVTGTIATVPAQLGATVSKGQTLATLEVGPLQNAVTAATAALAKAKATLETDSTTTTTNATTGSGKGTAVASAAPAAGVTSGRTSSGGAKTGGTTGGTTGTAKALAESATLLARSQQALTAATAACATSATTQPTTASPTASLTASPGSDAAAGPSPTPSAELSPTPGGGGRAGTAGDCATMLSAALDAQQKLNRSQSAANQALQAAASAGAGAAAASTPTTTGAAGTGTGTGTGSAGSSGSGQGGAASGQSQAARVTTDQAAVAAAEVALGVATKNLAGATLTSPLTGTIASQPFVVGAGSGTSSILILAPGAVQITVNVPATSIPALKVGQPAAVTPDGSTAALAGTVAAVGLLPTTSTSGSTTTYPVRVLVAKPGGTVTEGAAASVAITVKTVQGVLTVPNSAISDGAVTVLTQGTPVRTRVQTGAVGALTSQITSGLQAGQQVVLADLSAALPANSTTTTRGFGGNGGPPGGFGGAAPGGGQQVRPGG